MDAGHYTDPNTSDHQDDSDSQKIVKSKNPRRRKRAFYNSIRSQMEFYFGDANLSKDRFLMQLIKQDPLVPLDVFLKFNKIKKLCSSAEEIANALSHSELLKLNEDRTKVQRVTEIPENREVDNRTIYVESLPPTADHDWVINIFSRFGSVAYVSLPRFKISRKIKEFGFVEFEEPESVEKALAVFKAMGNVISVETSDPENLLSISSYAKEQEETEETGCDVMEERIGTKKRPNSPGSVAEQPDIKRQKTSMSPALVEEVESDRTESGDESEIPTQSNAAEVDDNSDAQVKKKKNRRKRHKKSLKKAEGLDFDMSELKILPKVEWKRLRNKYLNMQRKKVGEIKRAHLRKRENHPVKQAKVEMEKPQSMNFYGAGQDNSDADGCESSEVTNNSSVTNTSGERHLALERKPLFTYEPDLIVRINFPEPVIDVKSLKTEMKQYPGVKYVDVKEGLSQAFIRCETPRHAKNLKKRVSSAEHMCEILSGDAEIEYWNKIMRDRQMKLNKEVKVHQKRGREKLSKTLVTHIYFKDEE